MRRHDGSIRVGELSTEQLERGLERFPGLEAVVLDEVTRMEISSVSIVNDSAVKIDKCLDHAEVRCMEPNNDVRGTEPVFGHKHDANSE